MPQEPKGFFERLTGTRLMSEEEDPGEQEVTVAPSEEVDTEIIPSDEEIDEAVQEMEEVDQEEAYSDEDTGDGDEEQEGQLTVDVFQDDQNIIIQSTIAGVAPDDLDVLHHQRHGHRPRRTPP